jgi:hypothetical protein
MMLLPAAPGTCVHCATDHGAHDPHNFQSIFYGMRFLMKWGREFTHADCVAHLTEQRQLHYRQVLAEFGIEWTEPDGKPIREPYEKAE